MMKLIENRFEILRLIGSGGMCDVFIAYDHKNKNEIALKMVKKDQKSGRIIQRVSEEYLLLSRLKHPNLVKVFDLGAEGHYYTMEYVPGSPFNSSFLECEEQKIVSLLIVLGQILNGLHFIHTRGLVHLDLKPQNILVWKDRSSEKVEFQYHVKIMDFGLAREIDHIEDQDFLSGTLAYIAPEVLLPRRRMNPDRRADLFSLGIVIYEALTGSLPFSSTRLGDLIREHIEAAPVLPSSICTLIPEWLDKLILGMLSKNPSDRPASCEEVAHVLEQHGSIARLDDAQEIKLCGILNSKFVGREKEYNELTNLISMLDISSINSYQYLKRRKALPEKERKSSFPPYKMIVIEGEKGIGKSRLIDEIEIYCKKQGIDVFRTHCDEKSGSTFLGVNKIFRGLIKNLYQRDSKLINKYGDILTHFTSDFVDRLPEELERDGKADIERQRFILLDRISQFILDALSDLDIRNCVIIFEDIHQAESSGLDLLQYLARKITLFQIPVLMIASFRPEDISEHEKIQTENSPLEDFLSQENKEMYTHFIKIRQLDCNEVDELISSILGVKKTPPNLLKKVYKETGGNPFFIEEIMKVMVDELPCSVNETWDIPEQSEIRIPQSIKEVVDRRLEKIDQRIIELLSIAAIAGEKFQFTLISKISVHEESVIYGMFEDARTKGIIEIEKGEETLTYYFTHSGYRETLYNRIPDSEKRIFHGKIASIQESFEDNSDSRIDELSYHYFLSDNNEKAKYYLFRAARKAKRLFNYSKALSCFRKVLCLNLELPDNVQVLFELGVLESLLGQSKDALLRFEKALELLESPVHKNVSERKVELKSEELKLRANILNSCGNIHSDLRDFKKAGDYYANALKLREALKDEEGVASSLLNIGVLNLEQEKIENARILFTQSLNIAENKGFPKIVAFALNDLGWVHLSQGNYREALKVYKKSLKVSKGTGDKYAAAIAMTNIGEIFLENGKTWKATKYFQQSIRGMKAIGELQQLCSPLMGLGKIYTSLGRFHEADELLSNALEIAEISGLKIELANTLRSTGELEERKGNYRKAYLFFLRALNLQKSISDLRGEVLTLSELIQLNINLGRMKNTWCYIELCDRVARELGDPMEMAISSYYQGYYHLRIGNFEYASAHLNRSLGISRDIKYRIGVVKNLLRLGELSNMAGDNVKALEIYGEARRETRTYGLEWLYGEVLLNLAEIQYQKEDYAQSFQNIENSLAISRKYLDNLTESRAKNLGALIACEKAKFNTAELYFREAMETLKKLGNKFFLGICMVRYASYRKFIGENDCILILKKAEKLFSYIHANHWLMEIENIQKGCFND